MTAPGRREPTRGRMRRPITWLWAAFILLMSSSSASVVVNVNVPVHVEVHRDRVEYHGMGRRLEQPQKRKSSKSPCLTRRHHGAQRRHHSR
jgi:hypothetical protein